MDKKILISPNTLVDLDAVVFATLEFSSNDPHKEIPTINYALAGDPNKFMAFGMPARILWDALQERCEPAYLENRYLPKEKN